MLSQRIRLLNFDNSVTQQEKLFHQHHVSAFELTAIGPFCRLWANQHCAREIGKSLKPEHRHDVTFLGSGDFHHISSLLIEQFQEPISVIVFDFHPDLNTLPPRLGCGSWVTRILRNDAVKNVILLGVSSNDISSQSIFTLHLQSLLHNRVQIYPYSHQPTNVFFRHVPENISMRLEKRFLRTTIHWQELKNQNLEKFILGLLKQLQSRRMYISIDKDCLNSKAALTNWEEGCFRLDEVLRMLKILRENAEIIGADITGEYSLPKMRGVVKSLYSRFDHPRNFSARDADISRINSVNEETNLKLLEVLVQPTSTSTRQ